MEFSSLNMEQRRAVLEESVAMWQESAGRRRAPTNVRLSLAEVLASDCEEVRRMRVSAVVAALPGIGRTRARRILEELGISSSRRIHGLRVPEREGLLARCAPPH